MITELFEDLIDFLEKIGAVVMIALVLLFIVIITPFLILLELLDHLMMSGIERYFKLKRWHRDFEDRY